MTRFIPMLSLPAAYARDRFNRGDSTSVMGYSETNQQWSSLAGTWGLIGSKAYESAAGAGPNFATLDAGVSDAVLECTVTRGGGSVGLVVRADDASNLLYVFANGAATQLIKREGAANSTLINNLTTVQGTGVTKQYRIVLAGSTIVVYANEVLIGSASNAFNQTMTKFGLFSASSSANRYEDFRVVR